MSLRFLRAPTLFALSLGLLAFSAAPIRTLAADAPPAIAIDTARITISGTTNVHDYTASTQTIRLTRAEVPVGWERVQDPNAVTAFEVAIPSASLKSPKGDLDKNMWKALKTEQFPDIAFRLTKLDLAPTGALEATGVLRIAGVERPVTFGIKTQRAERLLTVSGQVSLLMTDFGITPPKAMLGMLKTNPLVTVTFETVLSLPPAA